MYPLLAASLTTNRKFALLARYTLCSAASTDRLFTIGWNANEAIQAWDPDASTFLTAVLKDGGGEEYTERIYCCKHLLK